MMTYIVIGILFAIILLICIKYWYLWSKLNLQKNEWMAHIKESDTILHSMNACFMLVDRDFVVLRTNYYDLNGIPGEPVSNRVGDLLKCKNAVRSEGCGAHHNCGSCMVRYTIENAFCHKKGFSKLEASMRLFSPDHQHIIPCDVSVSGTYLTDADQEQMLLTIYDITELKNTQRLLSIEKENAVSAEKLKSAFIANMSHEIRTPLNAIIGFSGLLASTDDDAEKKMYLDIVAENNHRLLQIVTDVLDLSKIESGSLDFHYSRFDVNDLLCGLHGILEIRLKDKPDIKLVCEAGTDEWMIYSEQQRIVQILTNLVHNAIKFTQNGEIRFGCRPHGETDVYFYVSDTGIGIPVGEQDKIFDRFTKLDHEVPGTGLGLTLSQTIVQSLGGEIGVESEVTKGSTFWFTLPLTS
ncbi:sensor histidine kinase [Bacteroides fragilis]|uniref:sensor histidine kinase n=1 Tax=Bacteroides fragilis TaxID=817 RepID=UPI0020306D73|nr:ATP-binding protein [Bacteroides fragilis]MCE8600552.1 sensor histidine kinase [Bacteroides fragilis]MCE8676637.1 sensor histidine kinase [Bacteroides fragilis]MCM0232486.1 sensor histidine kinase [Bacteroides fragilis]MCY1133784.1 ATP-binding protein [Bacteroides fragilis]